MTFEHALVATMARRCGLEDPDAFAHRREHEFARWQDKRGTGRTTRTLLQALCALEVGCSVEIVAADPAQARDLRERLHALATAAGLQRDYVVGRELWITWPGRELWITWPGREANRGRNPMDLRLVDHYAAERTTSPADAADAFGRGSALAAVVGPSTPVVFLEDRLERTPPPIAEWML